MRLGKYGKLLHWDDTSIGIGNIKRFTIIEIKYLFGIIVNIFNTVDQDRFHSHAFHAWSWMIRGYYHEHVLKKQDDPRYFHPHFPGVSVDFKKIERSRFIPKNYIHKITRSSPNAISITFEGPWGPTWDEFFDNGRIKHYSWGRKVLLDTKYPNGRPDVSE